ncbi:MAG: DPP IV N-terminal domain-containing protein [Planctomycetota bacterium]
MPASSVNGRIASALSTAIATCSIALLVGGCASSNTSSSRAEAAPRQDAGSMPAKRSMLSGARQDSTAILASSHSSRTGRSEPSNSPQFSMFGEIPASHAGSHQSRFPFEGTENIRQVTVSAYGRDFDPVAGPDGSHIFFASTRHRPTADIYSARIGSESVTQLTSDPAHDVMPSVSRDGQRIAFASNRNGSWDIYLMNATGGQAVQITDDPAQELHPSWSADGSKLAFCRLGIASDRWEVWVVDLNRQDAPQFLTYGLFPEWHPSEDTLLFQRSRDREDRFFTIWTVDYTNGGASSPTEIASSASAAFINPTWSTDGRFISYASVLNPPNAVPGTRPETADVWIQSADGGMATNITGGWFVNLMPTWGPRGDLFFVSDRDGFDNIWSINPRQAILAAGAEPPTGTDIANVNVNE